MKIRPAMTPNRGALGHREMRGPWPAVFTEFVILEDRRGSCPSSSI